MEGWGKLKGRVAPCVHQEPRFSPPSQGPGAPAVTEQHLKVTREPRPQVLGSGAPESLSSSKSSPVLTSHCHRASSWPGTRTKLLLRPNVKFQATSTWSSWTLLNNSNSCSERKKQDSDRDWIGRLRGPSGESCAEAMVIFSALFQF